MTLDESGLVRGLLAAHRTIALLGLAVSLVTAGLILLLVARPGTPAPRRVLSRLVSAGLVGIGAMLAIGAALIVLQPELGCPPSSRFCVSSRLIVGLPLVAILFATEAMAASRVHPIVMGLDRPSLATLEPDEIVRLSLGLAAPVAGWTALLAAAVAPETGGSLLVGLAVTWLGLGVMLLGGLVAAREFCRRRQPVVEAPVFQAFVPANDGAPPVGGSHLRIAAIRWSDDGPQLQEPRPEAEPAPLTSPAKLPAEAAAEPEPDANVASPEPEPVAKTTLESAMARCRSAAFGLVAISLGINVLALAGPLYMLQVYDRVLTSRSLETLALLTLLLLGLYLALGLVELIRARILARLALRLDRLLAPALLERVVSPATARSATVVSEPLRDLEQLRNFVSGPLPAALLDLPWVPLYCGLVFLLHPLLGVVTVAGAVILAGLSIASQLVTRSRLSDAAEEAARCHALVESGRRNAEVLRAMGMRQAHLGRWL